MSLQLACAVKRRRFPVGASPTRQPLQPEATGAVMEVTKWLKPSDSVSRYTVSEHAATLVRAARCADHARGRLQEFRLHVLDRAVRARQDTARDRRQACPGDAEGAGRAGRAGETRAARHGPMPITPAVFDAQIR